MKRLGVLTIGQSPREDVTPQFQKILGDQVTIVERGALDSLDMSGLNAIHPKQGEKTYISKLRNGNSIKISKERLMPLLQRELKQLEDEVDVVVMLCTGDFPQLTSDKLIFFPDQIITHVIKSILTGGKLGLIIPLEEQKNSLLQKWESLDLPIEVEAASPYADSDFSLAGKRLKERDAAL